MVKSYKISKIVAKRKHRGRVEYRIRWTGFKASQDTWEPAAEIMPVAYRLVRDFHNRSKTPTPSGSAATSVNSSPTERKEQQSAFLTTSPKKQQRQLKVMALQQQQQLPEQQQPAIIKSNSPSGTSGQLALKLGRTKPTGRAPTLALKQKKVSKRLQAAQRQQKRQTAKKKKKHKAESDVSPNTATDPTSGSSVGPPSSSSSASSSASASSGSSNNPAPPTKSSPPPPLLVRAAQPSAAALPSATIDWNLKYGIDGDGDREIVSKPPGLPSLSVSLPAAVSQDNVAEPSGANSSLPSVLTNSCQAVTAAPLPSPQQQQQRPCLQQSPSLPTSPQQQQTSTRHPASQSQAPTSSSIDLRRYHGEVLDAIEGIRRLKRKLLLDRVVQAICKKLRVGTCLAEAIIEDMIRLGFLHKVRSQADNSLTLYATAPHHHKRSASAVLVKPKSQQQQPKKANQIRNNFHELSVKQPSHSPGVVEIWLVGPRQNAGSQPGGCFTVRLLQELCRALQQALDNPACRLVRLASADPRCFSRGIDLAALLAARPGPEASMAVNQLTDELQRLVSAMVEFPKLLVATVTGACVGLGVALLPLCDFVYASDSSYFQLPYAQLKQTCEAGASYTLRQLLGNPTASEMLLAGRALTASEACARGLVSSVMFADTFQQEAALRCASIGASVGAENVRQTKALMHSASRPCIVQACQAECLALRSHWLREDARQLMRAYLDGQGLGNCMPS